MIGIIIILLFTFLSINISRFISRYFKQNNIHKVFNYLFNLILYGGLICMILGMLIPNGLHIRKTFVIIGYFWLGLILYFLIGLIFSLCISKIIRLIKKEEKINKIYDKVFGLFVLMFLVVMVVYGTIHAQDINIKNYEISINKKADVNEMNAVLISDLHLGYNTKTNYIENCVKKINELSPDVVLIGGDIFDNNYSAIDNPNELIKILQSINSKYGTYAVLGNHDVSEITLMGFTFGKNEEDCIDKKMLEFLDESNIKILYDDYVDINGVLIYGRPDKEKINLHNNIRLNPKQIMNKLDINKPIIVLDHEPSDYDEFSKLGCDIYLNGHTHKGQVWPGTLTINMFWDNAYGYKLYGDMHNIVTSGLGLFGPNMRIDSDAEICNIKIVLN